MWCSFFAVSRHLTPAGDQKGGAFCFDRFLFLMTAA
jgi:hypothetical protein